MADSGVTSRPRLSGMGSRVVLPPVVEPVYTAPPYSTVHPLPDYLHWKQPRQKKPIQLFVEDTFYKVSQSEQQKDKTREATEDEQKPEVAENAQNAARRIPLDALARDWLRENPTTTETRLYVLDRLLPTLILGVEKLLVEADRRGLVTGPRDRDPEFNPINYLAQYLMRNNPRYSHLNSETSPYVRGLREVMEELRVQLLEQDGRLMGLMAERDRREDAARVERARREGALRAQYTEWGATLPAGEEGEETETLSGEPRVQLALVQNALLSFRELIATQLGPEQPEPDEQPKPEVQETPEVTNAHAPFSGKLDATDETGKTLGQEEFVSYVLGLAGEMESFDRLLLHLSQCADSYRKHMARERRRKDLDELFDSCDHTKVGSLDRHRVLNLFEMFYDQASQETIPSFRNPRLWPVVDVVQIDPDNYEDQEPSNNFNISMATKHSQEEACSQSEAQQQVVYQNEAEPEPQSESEVEPQKEAERNLEVDSIGGEAKVAGKSVEIVETGEEELKVADDKDKKIVEEKDTDCNAGENDKEKVDVDKVIKESEEEINSKDETQEKEREKEELRDVVAEEGETEERAAKEGTTEGEGKDTDETSVSIETNKEQTEQESRSSVQTSIFPPMGALPPPGTGSEVESEMRPPRTQQSHVSFADGTSFQRERTVSARTLGTQSQASVYYEETLNSTQFAQLVETFLGDAPSRDGFQALLKWIREGYRETEEERLARLIKVHREAVAAEHRSVLNSLFELWDTDGSGFVDSAEVEGVMRKYKDGTEADVIDAAKQELLERLGVSRLDRMSGREFRAFLHNVMTHLAEAEENHERFLEFLVNSIERSNAQRVRGEARREWLQYISQAGGLAGVNIEPVYKAVFHVLRKDAEMHGSARHVSANIAMLERSDDVMTSRGDVMLRYVASTPDDAALLLGKALYPDMRCVSFSAVETGTPVHVPKVKAHGGVHFWNPNRNSKDRDGSLVVLPLTDSHGRVFGTLAIDTLHSAQGSNIFITNQIHFFQGVAAAFSAAYHEMDTRRSMLHVCESAVTWVTRRCAQVRDVTVYMVEHPEEGDYALRKMLTAGENGDISRYKNPVKLQRKDNVFREYVFTCVDSSETVTVDSYGERHLAVPVRNTEGRAATVIDINIGDARELAGGERMEMTGILKVLQNAYTHILKASQEEEIPAAPTVEAGQIQGFLTEVEVTGSEVSSEALFDWLMLQELRRHVTKLDAKSFAELRSYNQPPQVIHDVVRAVLTIFHPDRARARAFDSWPRCKRYLTSSLGQQVAAFDPKSYPIETIPLDLIHRYLKDVGEGDVRAQGSIPAHRLFKWLHVGVALIEQKQEYKALSAPRVFTKKKSKETEVGPVKDSTVPEAMPGVRPETLGEPTDNDQSETATPAADEVGPVGDEEQEKGTGTPRADEPTSGEDPVEGACVPDGDTPVIKRHPEQGVSADNVYYQQSATPEVGELLDNEQLGAPSNEGDTGTVVIGEGVSSGNGHQQLATPVNEDACTGVLDVGEPVGDNLEEFGAPNVDAPVSDTHAQSATPEQPITSGTERSSSARSDERSPRAGAERE